jgi:pilus assembly protein Flp/PilA
MVNVIKNLLTDDSGASAAEYALILAIVGTGIATAAHLLGVAISGSMTTATTCIGTAAGATPPAGC